MGTKITLVADDFTLTMTGDGIYSGCTYDRLDGWYGVDNVNDDMTDRPNAPGSFAPAQTFPSKAVIGIEGDFFGMTRASALAMREDLALLYNEGRDVKMIVEDDLRTSWRWVKIVSVNFPWTIHPEFPFTIDATAADPRRYGDEQVQTTGLAEPGTGMTWPAVWPVDWGTIGTTGRIEVANTGNTETTLRFEVTGGAMPDGFVIANVETGERITYLGPVSTASSVVTIDGTIRAAFIDGTGPGSRFLYSPQWFGIRRRSTVELQFLARGPVSGSPKLTAYASPAFY